MVRSSIVASVAVIALVLTGGTSRTLAQTDRTITVLGNGIAKAPAGSVTLQLTVSSQDQTATGLFVKQNDVVQRLRKTLTGAGVNARDIRELPFRLMPNYEYGQQGTRIIGYRLDTPLELDITDVASLPHVIDLATQGGASTISVGSFSAGHRQAPLHDEAVSNALSDARREAEMLAKQMGRTVGDIVSVTEMEDEGKAGAPAGGEEAEEKREREQLQATQPGTLSEKAELRVVFQLR